MNSKAILSTIRTHRFEALVSLLIALVLLFLAFEAGVAIGYRKATFSGRVGTAFERNFGAMERHGAYRAFMGPGTQAPNPHGAVGRIVEVSLPLITIESEGKPEQLVRIGGDTVIKQFDKTLAPADLTVDSHIVILGSPNDAGEIDAKLIRLLPPPPVAEDAALPATGN